jgi:predicted nicotinamide N-methyase
MVANQSIPGGWRNQTIGLSGRTFVLRLPANPDALFEHVEAHPECAADFGEDLFWTQLWPTAWKLAENVLGAWWPRGAQAIELGCGAGLVGLAAAAKGLQVTFSDSSPLAVRMAVENSASNGFAEVEGIVLDWRHPPNRTFDVILASDVIYDPQLHGPLLKTLNAITHANSVIWIGDCGRAASERFVKEAGRTWRVGVRTASPDYQRIELRHPH